MSWLMRISAAKKSTWGTLEMKDLPLNTTRWLATFNATVTRIDDDAWIINSAKPDPVIGAFWNGATISSTTKFPVIQ